MKRRDLIWFSALAAAVPLAYGSALLLNRARGSHALSDTVVPIADMEGDLVFGAADAPATVLAYVSLTCSHCRVWEKEQMPEVLRTLVDTGKARLILRDFPLDGPALAAASLLRCLPESLRKTSQAALMQANAVWPLAGVAGTPAALSAAAAALDMSRKDRSEAVACASTDKVQERVVATRLDAASRYGVQATPTFVVGRHIQSGGIPASQITTWLSEQ